MIHGKNLRLIKAQNSESHGSMDPLTVSNRLTRGPEAVGTTWQSADHYGRPSGPRRHRPPASAGSFLPPFLSRLKVLRLLQLGARPPFAPSINMRGGTNEDKHKLKF